MKASEAAIISQGMKFVEVIRQLRYATEGNRLDA
jgi:hypothetical protein